MKRKSIKAIMISDVELFLKEHPEFSRPSFGKAICNDEHLYYNIKNWTVSGKTIEKVYEFMADYKAPA